MRTWSRRAGSRFGSSVGFFELSEPPIVEEVLHLRNRPSHRGCCRLSTLLHCMSIAGRQRTTGSTVAPCYRHLSTRTDLLHLAMASNHYCARATSSRSLAHRNDASADEIAGRFIDVFVADFQQNGAIHEKNHAETANPIMVPEILS